MVGVAIIVTVGMIVNVCEVTVEMVDTFGAVVEVDPVVTVVMEKIVTVSSETPGKVVNVVMVVVGMNSVESIVALRVVVDPKFRTTMTVVE